MASKRTKLLDRGTTFTGPIVSSGRNHPDAAFHDVFADIPAEVIRSRYIRGAAFDVGKAGTPHQIATTQPQFGGFKMGGRSATDGTLGTFGSAKDGWVNLGASATADAQVIVIGPSCMGPTVGEVMKFYGRIKVDDVDKIDFMIGLATDPSAGTNPPEFWVEATDAIGQDMTDAICFHREDGDSASVINLSVFDNAVNTNSTVAIALPTPITDNMDLEFGLVVHGVSSIDYVIRQGGTYVTEGSLSASSFAELATDLLKMGPAFSFHHNEAVAHTAYLRELWAFANYADEYTA